MSVLIKFLLLFSFQVFASAEVKPQRYIAPKMVCQNCADAITKALKKNKRIKKVNFDIEKKSFTFEVNSGEAKLSKKELQAVKDESLYLIVPARKK